MTDLMAARSASRSARGRVPRTLAAFATLALLASGAVVMDAPAASAQALLASGTPATTALPNLKINTITGTVFQDLNGNGTRNLDAAEFGVKGQTVKLFRSLSDATSGAAPIASTTTGTTGVFAFKSLAKGEYFLSFTGNSDYQPSPNAANAIGADGQPIPSIIPVNISKNSLLFTQNLPLKRITNLSVTPFNDVNTNGVQDNGEAVMNDKTMIIIDLRKFADAVKNGTLANIDVAQLASSSLAGGNIDLLDGISLRTTKNGQAIQLPDVDPAVRLIVRSPVNLTLTDMASNLNRIEAIASLLQGGDISALLNDPAALATDGIDTNNETYARKLSEAFAQLAQKVDGLSIPGALSNTGTSLSTQTSSQLRTIANLLSAIPAYRLGIVTYFGNSYDVTGLKFTKTNNFLFGIKNPPSIKGSVFVDLDSNGTQGSLELSGASATVTVYNEAGQVLGTASTSALSPAYEIKNLPFDAPLYVGVETANPVSPTLDNADLPAALIGRTIVGKQIVSKTAAQSAATQNIAVLGSKPTSVSASLAKVDVTAGTVTLNLTNTDRLSSPVVTLQLNGGTTQTVTLPRAPLFGSPKATAVTFTGIAAVGTNRVQASWQSGVYKISLAEISF